MAKPRRSQGFTLIELLIVISIIATFALATGLTPNSRGGRAGSPGAIAQALAADFEAARDGAILGRHHRALQPGHRGWQILDYDRKANRWAVIKERNWRGIQFQWKLAGQGYLPTTALSAPPVRFLPDGRVSPFSLTVRRARASARCQHAKTGVLQCDSR